MPIPLGDKYKDRPRRIVDKDGDSFYQRGNVWVYCPHDAKGTTYTRKPCVCGRPLWPPRGRGRGESLYSPRRVAAIGRAVDMYNDYWRGMSWRQVARKYGYSGPSGAWQVVYRNADKIPGSQPGYRAPNMKRMGALLAVIEAEAQAIVAGEPERQRK